MKTPGICPGVHHQMKDSDRLTGRRRNHACAARNRARDAAGRLRDAAAGSCRPLAASKAPGAGGAPEKSARRSRIGPPSPLGGSTAIATAAAATRSRHRHHRPPAATTAAAIATATAATIAAATAAVTTAATAPAAIATAATAAAVGRTRAATTAAAKSTTTTTGLTFDGLTHGDRTAVEQGTVHGLHRCSTHFVGFHLEEGEAAAAAGLAIHDHFRRGDSPELGEGFLQTLGRDGVGQIAHKQFTTHSRLWAGGTNERSPARACWTIASKRLVDL